MAFSVTQMRLAAAIEASGMTDREIADRVGYKQPNLITMMRQGEIPVPLKQIPSLARTLGIEERTFLMVAIEEYHPRVQEALVDVMGLPELDTELGLMVMFRIANMHDNAEVKEPFTKALEAMLDLARLAMS